MPQTPHVEMHFMPSETIRDIVIGMSDGLTTREPEKEAGPRLPWIGRARR